ncbi:helix-turn-helix domain-containing protein [Clostridium botulinum]|uniref:helix-turn-helix domain-containing protein n=1 Tax=Clostridium botulinum TaxID=1491 RepID=UPI0013F0220B|nr:helix-turn-helix domain-containing protein [Clostridium botulinum]MBN1061289.1 helix-turn-helix domain-containing protein [Clostridium botulinum]MCS6110736.1 helix-turn-helix domain-containing protein [Clostridium botulinum]NFE11266.1 helix-turn-helix domain-containing protein [Clostridium botulinum]
MSQSKDFIKFRKYIRTQNLKINEQYLLEYLFEYTNTSYGYAFPKFSNIMEAFNTTSKNRISSTIKKLEKKGLIKVDRTHTNNRYYVIGIESFINQSKHNNKIDKETKELKGQMSIDELTPEEKELIELTSFTQNQVKKLLELSKNKLDKVMSTFRYAVKNGANNVYGYVKALLERNISVDNNFTREKKSYYKKEIPFITSCEGRNYSNEWYENIENKLLGWT